MKATSWFDIRELEPGIFALDETRHVERVKSHLIVGRERAILLDTGMGVANIRTEVERITDLPVTVVNSHAHWDHIGGNALFDDILIHPAEADDLIHGYPNERMRHWFTSESLTGPLPDGVNVDSLAISPSTATGFVNEGDVIDLGNRRLDILHCPGHSPGGIVLLDAANGILFSTDVAYQGYLYAYRGRALPTYAMSLRRLASLAPDLRVLYPSHNAAVVSPDRLVPMADALDRVISGADPRAVDGERTTFEFDGVGVYLFPERYVD
jgi:glyoxylase-like metal-dependent hydrolase (beta-lactamase superfamily II)